MKHVNLIMFFLLLATCVFGQLQYGAPIAVLQYLDSQKQFDAYNKWDTDNDAFERFIANINKETKGVKWRFRDRFSHNKCYERLAYLSTYLYKRRIGKAKTCISADSCKGIKIWMDLNRRRVRLLRDFVCIPNVFNHTLLPEKKLEYEKIAEMIGEQVYKDVIKDEPVDYNEFVIIYFRAKKREKSLCCIVVKDGEKCFAKRSYFLQKPIY